jgi:hypothetical protein
VQVLFSPDERFQGHEAAAAGPSLRIPHWEQMRFGKFAELLATSGRAEHLAVSQSRSASLDEFDGLPGLDEMLAHLRRATQALRPLGDARAVQQNLWVSRPPVLSRLHFDSLDSLQVQLVGSKRFTLVDPSQLHGLTTHPAAAPIVQLERLTPGRFEAHAVDDPVEVAARSNFPQLNATHPDVARHPLARHARIVTVDVPEGGALLVPAGWFHQVESFAVEPSGLCVAINYWFSSGELPAILHAIMREPRHGLQVNLSAASPAAGGQQLPAPRLSAKARFEDRRTCEQSRAPAPEHAPEPTEDAGSILL